LMTPRSRKEGDKVNMPSQALLDFQVGNPPFASSVNSRHAMVTIGTYIGATRFFSGRWFRLYGSDAHSLTTT
jgi:hypothetical protein